MKSPTRVSCAVIFAVLACGRVDAAEPPAWPPSIDESYVVKPSAGRKVEVFRHGTRLEWGYVKPQQDYFILVHPERPSPKSPVYVVLHSAGHDGKSAYEIGSEGPEGPRGHFLYAPPADCYGLYPDCRANGGVGDWWWGGPEPNQKPPRNMGVDPTPAEKRVEETVKWVLANYSTDANRVYLTGISMGGSGSLGIGVPRGNLFASILVHVPAGAVHVEQRMRFPPAEVPAGITLADPPVVVAYSGVDDGWARDQATLIKGMHDRKYAFVDLWGPSGHDSTRQHIISKCDLAFSFPWLEIRKDEAYPVFTDATSDSKAPWLIKEGSDSTGQINAFFRWKNQIDTRNEFATVLRLVSADEVKTKMAVPIESTADVTLRRLQQFHVRSGQRINWEFTCEGHATAKGTIQAEESGLLTIPRLTIRQTPGKLSLKSVP